MRRNEVLGQNIVDEDKREETQEAEARIIG